MSLPLAHNPMKKYVGTMLGNTGDKFDAGPVIDNRIAIFSLVHWLPMAMPRTTDSPVSK
jgi:hypothetical protein